MADSGDPEIVASVAAPETATPTETVAPVETVESTINTLVEMGFSKDKATKALNKTGWSGVQVAMEWLLAHADDIDDDEDDAVEVVAEPPRILTEEEKAEKILKMEELRVKKRAEREEREKAEHHQKERMRVKDGKQMGAIKQQMADQELIKAAQDRRRDIQETQKAKDRVKAQIESDKQARREKEAQRTGTALPAAATVSTPPTQMVQKTESGKYEETRIQMRLPDGTAMVQKFKAKEPLSAVRLYVDMNRKDGGANAKLMTNFPKKVFADEDYETPLEALGLVPSAVVIVSR